MQRNYYYYGQNAKADNQIALSNTANMKQLAFLFTAFSFIACNKQKVHVDNNAFDSNIKIELREVIDTTGRKLNLICHTEKIYSCINYAILVDENFESNPWSVTFTGVEESEACLTALGPASVVVQLPTLGNGTYSIGLNNAGLSNNGELIITNDELKLNVSQPKGISIVPSSTMRIPQNTWWGTIGYHTATTAPKVNEFLQKAADLGAQFNKQTPGHYFYYQIDNNGDVMADAANSGYYFMKAFVFQYTGDDAAFAAALKQLAKTYFDDMYINIQNDKGGHIYNWL